MGAANALLKWRIASTHMKPTPLEVAVLAHLLIYRSRSRHDIALAMAPHLEAQQAIEGKDQYRLLKTALARLVSRGHAVNNRRQWSLTTEGRAHILALIKEAGP